MCRAGDGLFSTTEDLTRTDLIWALISTLPQCASQALHLIVEHLAMSTTHAETRQEMMLNDRQWLFDRHRSSAECWTTLTRGW